MCSAWHLSSSQYLTKEGHIVLVLHICNIAKASEFSSEVFLYLVISLNQITKSTTYVLYILHSLIP